MAEELLLLVIRGKGFHRTKGPHKCFQEFVDVSTAEVSVFSVYSGNTNGSYRAWKVKAS